MASLEFLIFHQALGSLIQKWILLPVPTLLNAAQEPLIPPQQ